MIKLGTAGFRGVDGKDFDEQVVQIISQSACNIIIRNKLKKEVVVGFDKRLHSRLYAHEVCRVLVANKIKTILCPFSEPTPLVSFVTKEKSNDISLMVTSSHNPYIYNGIKIFGQGGKDISSQMEEAFNAEVERLKPSDVKIISWQQCKNNPLFSLQNFENEYVDSIISQIKHPPQNISAIFETMGGSSYRCAKLLAKKLNKNNIYITNINTISKTLPLAPIPTEENLSHLAGLIEKHNCKFAFATDGDGDRLAVVSPSGKYYNSADIAPFIYDFAVRHKNEKGSFVCNKSFSILGALACKKLGKNYYTCDIGYKNIENMMAQKKANFGAENSSLCLKPHSPTKDGLMAFALLLEAIAHTENEGKTFDEIMSSFKKECGYNFSYKEESFSLDKNFDISKLENFVPIPEKKLVSKEIFGTNIKFVFEDNSFVLIRQSGTEKLMRIVVDLPNSCDINKVIQNVYDGIKQIVGI